MAYGQGDEPKPSGQTVVIHQGKLGSDPEIKEVGDGRVLEMRIASNILQKDEKGHTYSQAIWIRASLWERYAGHLDHVKRGYRTGVTCTVEGPIKRWQPYLDKEGKPQIGVDVTVDRIWTYGVYEENDEGAPRSAPARRQQAAPSPALTQVF